MLGDPAYYADGSRGSEGPSSCQHQGLHFYLPVLSHVTVALEDDVASCLHTGGGFGAHGPASAWGGARRPEDPVAVLRVSLRQMRDVFTFATPRLSAPGVLLGGSNSKTQFRVDMRRWPADLVLSRALVVENAVCFRDQLGRHFANAEMSIAHDFLRHVARHLFNIPHGMRLFRNADQVLRSIHAVCDSQHTFHRLLGTAAADTTASTTTTANETDNNDASSSKINEDEEEEDSSSSTINIQERAAAALLTQMAMQDPQRFERMPDKKTFHRMPFERNDAICVSLTIRPSRRQHEVLALPLAGGPVPPKTYFIKLVLS